MSLLMDNNFFFSLMHLLFDKDQARQSRIITPTQEAFVEKYCITSRWYFV